MVARAAAVALSLLVGVSCSSSRATLDVTAVSSGVDAMLLDVAFADAQVALAVGGTTERGPSVVVRSDDGGVSWSTVDAAADGRLYGVAWASRDDACAVGYGVAVHSSDGGRSWSPSATPGEEIPWLGGLTMVPGTSTGFAVGGGDAPVLWRTDDAGASWRDVAVGDDLAGAGLRAIAAFDARHLVTVGSGGALATSDDAGATWSRRESATDDWLKSVAVVGARDAFVVGARGSLLVTHDAGARWTRRATPDVEKFHVLAGTDRSRVVLGATDGRVFVTLDGGTTWSLVHASTTGAWIGAARRPASGDELWLCGESGQLLRIRAG